MSGNNLVTLDLPAAPGYSRAVDEAIATLVSQVDDVPDMATLQHNIYLAAHEVCLNIVEHAYHNQPDTRFRVVVRLEDEPRRLVIETEDAGASFDPALVPEPDLAQGQERGYGLFIARHLMDEVTYSPAPGHNRWRLVKYF